MCGYVYNGRFAIMNYKTEIIKMIEKVTDENVLEYLYYFLKGKLKAGH